MRWRRAPWAAATALLAVLFTADASAVLVVSLPWLRPAADARNAELFLEISSTDAAALVGASSVAAERATLLAPGKAAKPAAEIALPANSAVHLAPGAWRIALTRLTRPLKIGDHVPVNLTIQSADGKRQELLISAEVRLRSAYDDEMTHPHKHHEHARAAQVTSERI